MGVQIAPMSSQARKDSANGISTRVEPQRTTLSIGTEQGSRRSSSRRCQWPARPFLPEINASSRSISMRIAEDAKCITANTENSAGKNACKININLQSHWSDLRSHFESWGSTGGLVRRLGSNHDYASFIYW